MATKKQKAVIVTTLHRGVFFGYVPAAQDMTARTLALTGARCAIYWGTTGGIGELAATGPTEDTRLGTQADIPCLHDVTAIWSVTPEAEAKWTR